MESRWNTQTNEGTSKRNGERGKGEHGGMNTDSMKRTHYPESDEAQRFKGAAGGGMQGNGNQIKGRWYHGGENQTIENQTADRRRVNRLHREGKDSMSEGGKMFENLLGGGVGGCWGCGCGGRGPEESPAAGLSHCGNNVDPEPGEAGRKEEWKKSERCHTPS